MGVGPRHTIIGLLCFAGLLTTTAGSQSPAHAIQAQVSKKRSELFRPLPLTKFYDTPDPLPPGKPGDLIRSTQFDEYDLPPEVNALRILYHSRTAAGEDVAVSGVILFRDAKPPAGGWPIVAWAHSWTGVARSCAPSLARNLQHGPFLAMYVHLGYAVVASDYAGLGTSSRSAFADIFSNAADVIHAVTAARRALPQLGSRWIAMGTGEGGMAVAGIAESESRFDDPNYLGSVAISRLADMQTLYASESLLSYQTPLLLAYGVKTAFQQFNVSDMLTPAAASLYDKIKAAMDPEANQKIPPPACSSQAGSRMRSFKNILSATASACSPPLGRCW